MHAQLLLLFFVGVSQVVATPVPCPNPGPNPASGVSTKSSAGTKIPTGFTKDPETGYLFNLKTGEVRDPTTGDTVVPPESSAGASGPSAGGDSTTSPSAGDSSGTPGGGDSDPYSDPSLYGGDPNAALGAPAAAPAPAGGGTMSTVKKVGLGLVSGYLLKQWLASRKGRTELAKNGHGAIKSMTRGNSGVLERIQTQHVPEPSNQQAQGNSQHSQAPKAQTPDPADAHGIQRTVIHGPPVTSKKGKGKKGKAAATRPKQRTDSSKPGGKAAKKEQKKNELKKGQEQLKNDQAALKKKKAALKRKKQALKKQQKDLEERRAELERAHAAQATHSEGGGFLKELGDAANDAADVAEKTLKRVPDGASKG